MNLNVSNINDLGVPTGALYVDLSHEFLFGVDQNKDSKILHEI